MATDAKQLAEVELVGPNDRQTARLDHARALSRRAQALLAAAGESVPDRHWYVLRVAPRAEKSVDTALENAAVERWLPVSEVKPIRRGKRKWQDLSTRSVLAWPGYIFVKVANTAYCWAGLSTLDDVLGVLGTAERPIAISDEKVFRYKLFLERDSHAHEVLSGTLKVGEEVRIEEGPLTSVVGTVRELGRDGKIDRIRVEMWLFGRAALVDLDLAQVAKL